MATTFDPTEGTTYRISLRNDVDRCLELRRDGSIGIEWLSPLGHQQHVSIFRLLGLLFDLLTRSLPSGT
jgi:hypothetical protein